MHSTMADTTEAKRQYINVEVPAEMLVLVDKAAGTTSRAGWARVVLAKALNYTLPAGTVVSKRQKYNTPAEAEAAKTAYATTRAAAIAALLADPVNAEKVKKLLAEATEKAVAEVRAKAATPAA